MNFCLPLIIILKLCKKKTLKVNEKKKNVMTKYSNPTKIFETKIQ